MSERMLLILLAVLALPVLIFGLIARSMAGAVLRMSRPHMRMEPTHPVACAYAFDEAIDPYMDWAAKQQMVPEGCFRMNTEPRLAIHHWYNPQRRLWLDVQVYSQEQYWHAIPSITSSLSEDEGLCTTNNTLAAIMPRPPGYHLQVIVTEDLDDLLEAHERGLRYLQSIRAYPTSHDGYKPAADLLTEGSARTMRHVRSLPLWWLRTPWWYLRRGRLTNLTIEQQDHSSMLRFPGGM